jgi:2-C-methyl-D-erythritol 4-phosphate cytidylyltransferase
MAELVSHWAVVPAAGIGARMGGDQPKQYLRLAGQPVLQRTLDALLAWERVERVVVALAEGDRLWSTLDAARDSRVTTATGGAMRSDSVLAGLQCLADVAARDDWVLVHDAARPCLRLADIQRLAAALVDDPVGGILAVPVAETVKRASDDTRVRETLPRADLWLAQTPQMFRYGVLCDAMSLAVHSGNPVTDESAAIERAGFNPRLIRGHPANIKITRPEDLLLAEHFLALQEE